MKDLLQKFSFLTGLNSCFGETKQILLFDSHDAAVDVAFMLGSEWDGCNGVVVLPNFDEIAVNTAAKLVGSSWCYSGKSCALLPKLSIEALKRSYAAGNRYFINANLMCADLTHLNLSQVNLGWAKLRGANLSGVNLSGADLTAADLSDANLTGANLSGANLSRADLSVANLCDANTSGACLRGVKV